jgi:hypothetical protein
MVNNVIGVVNYVIAARSSLLNFVIAEVSSGIRCKSAGVVPGSMVMLGDGCDSVGLILGLGHGGGLRP